MRYIDYKLRRALDGSIQVYDNNFDIVDNIIKFYFSIYNMSIPFFDFGEGISSLLFSLDDEDDIEAVMDDEVRKINNIIDRYGYSVIDYFVTIDKQRSELKMQFIISNGKTVNVEVNNVV